MKFEPTEWKHSAKGYGKYYIVEEKGTFYVSWMCQEDDQARELFNLSFKNPLKYKMRLDGFGGAFETFTEAKKYCAKHLSIIKKVIEKAEPGESYSG